MDLLSQVKLMHHMMRICLLLIIFSITLNAEIPVFKAIVLQGDFSSHVEQNESGIVIENMTVPGSEEALKARLSRFLEGKIISIDELSAIKREILAYYQEHHLPFVTVLVPEQEITCGTLKLVVFESRVGQIEVIGNRHFPSKLFLGYIRLKPGDPIDPETILDDVLWMNKNPFHYTQVVFAPGKEYKTTDICLVTKDRRTVRLFAGLDNTGTRFTGDLRWFGGFNWANAFFADQIFTYQYTASFDMHQFQGHTFNYVIPLPWRNIMILYGGVSEVHPKLRYLRQDGYSTQASFRYDFPFGKHDLKLGCDFKSTNNNLEFSEKGGVISSHRANLTQAVVGYHFEREKFSLEAEIFYSPAAWIPHQSKKDFRAIRKFALPEYFYGRLMIEDRFIFHDWELTALGRGQLSNRNLLASEQFGLGGYNTVRGYEERDVNFDNALCLNVEIHTPSFAIFKRDKMFFLGFVDYGFGRNHEILPQEKSKHLLGYGPGVRYNIAKNITSRLDWAFPLSGNSRIHFEVIASY